MAAITRRHSNMRMTNLFFCRSMFFFRLCTHRIFSPPNKKKDTVSRVLVRRKNVLPHPFPLGHLSATAVTRRLQRSTRGVSPENQTAYLILLQMRFAYAVFVANYAVGSYPAFSPLPFWGGYFLKHFLSASVLYNEQAIAAY